MSTEISADLTRQLLISRARSVAAAALAAGVNPDELHQAVRDAETAMAAAAKARRRGLRVVR